MPFNINALPDYDQLVYELLHESMDHLIDLGARCNAHSDILEAEPDDPEDEQPHPLKVLKAQLQLDGAEDEVQAVQNLIQITSNLLVIRHSRRVVHHGSPPPPVIDDQPGAGAQDSSSLPHEPGCESPCGGR